MWQVLLAAAAAAGSGILAKKLINPFDTQKPSFDLTQNDQNCHQNEYTERQDPVLDDGRIFRFSSSEKGSMDLKKDIRSGLKKNGGSKRGKKNGSVESSRKGVSVCLKKRKTGKHASGNCESCASKDNSFGWGLGVGIMYMMSTGKAEINKLNCAMDETSKIVQELKAEISRRKKGTHNVNVLTENEDEAYKKYIERSYNSPLLSKINGESKDKIKTFGLMWSEEGDCSSSVLTEDQQPEVLEMNQLEAELESELQKLPFYGSEGRTNLFEAEVLSKEHTIKDLDNSKSYQYAGVLPVELDKKLSHLLIEQQESQIVELETELQSAHSKLHEKEAELRALKECVKRLTEFSLANASDEEIEGHEEDVKARDGIEFESRKSTVGMKRPMGYDESYICATK